ncbi:MAG: exopolysaccharide biosynthesis polyprenyl glycosylphosphotransferase [Acidobacteriota bacterium]
MVTESGSVLIIGQGRSAELCSSTLISRGAGRFRLSGVVTPLQVQELLRPLDSPHPHGKFRKVPERWVVALDDRRAGLPLESLLQARFRGVKIQNASQFLEDLTGQVPVKQTRPGDLVFSNGFAFSPAWMLLKTVWEWCLAVLLMVLVAPVLLAAALAIKLDDRGPIFFRQTRVGRFGRLFDVIKLRTMRQNAEAAGPQFAALDDPRVTRVGKFLRQTRIDELPQLFNILRGEMALVGPRPERPEFVEQYSKEIEFFDLRLSVRPGITGWAQVNEGYTSDSDGAIEKLSFDMYYLKHMSPLLDMRIVFDTVATVVKCEGV